MVLDASSMRQCSMLFSTLRVGKSGSYIDEWFASVVKPKSFYENFGCSDASKANRSGAGKIASSRCYFYTIDLQGRLFLEETLPKNVATSIKDDRFLDFFFSRIRYTSDEQQNWMKSNDIPVEDYPFVSACGRELNFIRPAATPIVYHTITPYDNCTPLSLVYGGKSLLQPFDALQGIAISQETGRLYHKLTERTLSRGGSQRNVGVDYGLIRSSVAVALSDRIIDDSSTDKQSCSGMGFNTGENGIVVPIPWLPLDSEPGTWAMPSYFGD